MVRLRILKWFTFIRTETTYTEKTLCFPRLNAKCLPKMTKDIILLNNFLIHCETPLKTYTCSHSFFIGFKLRDFRLVESLEKDRWNFKKIHGTYSFSYNRWFITEAPRQNIKELVLSSQKNKVSSSQFSQNWAIQNLLKFNSAPSFMCLLDSISIHYHLVEHDAPAGLLGFLIYQ